MSLRLNPKRSSRERRVMRKGQVEAASAWQEAIRLRQDREETFLCHEGTDVVGSPRIGYRAARELVPMLLVVADELADAGKAEATAREAFLATLDH